MNFLNTVNYSFLTYVKHNQSYELEEKYEQKNIKKRNTQ